MSTIKERELDVPFRLGDDYFIESKKCQPFYEVPLFREFDFRWATQAEIKLSDFPHRVVGIFRRCEGGHINGVFTYKLDLEEYGKEYKPRVQETP